MNAKHLFRKIRSSWVALFACLVGMSASTGYAQDKPLKVFLLVGQSNMQGHAHVRTLPHIGMDPKTESMLTEIQNEDGSPRIFEDVWISYLSSGVKQGQLTTGFGADENKIGPELMFGITMQKHLGEPILIIKTAWGGKSLNTDFRPPSAGPFQFREEQLKQFADQGKDLEQIKSDKTQATGHYYRLMIDHVKTVLADIESVYPDYDSDQGYELSGFVWFQGWNDMVDRGVYPNRDKPGGYDQYSEVLAHFIRDVRKDLQAPELPFVIGVMGAGGPTDKYTPEQMRYKAVHQNFRDAMAAAADVKEFRGNVVNVLTEDSWDLELTRLKIRQGKINQQVNQAKKENELSREKEADLRKKLTAETFTEGELAILETGISNAEYHYLGSSKIMAQIGRAFAEALK